MLVQEMLVLIQWLEMDSKSSEILTTAVFDFYTDKQTDDAKTGFPAFSCTTVPLVSLSYTSQNRSIM